MSLIERDFGTPAPDRRLREPAPATVQVTIDGQTVAVSEGTSVMRAAAIWARAALTTNGTGQHCQMARVRQARGEGVREEPLSEAP